MTYVKQLEMYEEAVMKKRMEEMTEAEVGDARARALAPLLFRGVWQMSGWWRGSWSIGQPSKHSWAPAAASRRGALQRYHPSRARFIGTMSNNCKTPFKHFLNTPQVQDLMKDVDAERARRASRR